MEAMTNVSAYVMPGIKCPDEIISDVFKITIEQIQNCSRRFRPGTEARQFSIWFHLNYCGLKPKEASGIYRKNRSTAYSSVKVINNLLETNKEFRLKAETAIQRLKEAGYGKD